MQPWSLVPSLKSAPAPLIIVSNSFPPCSFTSGAQERCNYLWTLDKQLCQEQGIALSDVGGFLLPSLSGPCQDRTLTPLSSLPI